MKLAEIPCTGGRKRQQAAETELLERDGNAGVDEVLVDRLHDRQRWCALDIGADSRAQHWMTDCQSPFDSPSPAKRSCGPDVKRSAPREPMVGGEQARWLFRTVVGAQVRV